MDHHTKQSMKHWKCIFVLKRSPKGNPPTMPCPSKTRDHHCIHELMCYVHLIILLIRIIDLLFLRIVNIISWSKQMTETPLSRAIAAIPSFDTRGKCANVHIIILLIGIINFLFPRTINIILWSKQMIETPFSCSIAPQYGTRFQEHLTKIPRICVSEYRVVASVPDHSDHSEIHLRKLWAKLRRIIRKFIRESYEQNSDLSLLAKLWSSSFSRCSVLSLLRFLPALLVLLLFCSSGCAWFAPALL
jgi:hypothetical protein